MTIVEQYLEKPFWVIDFLPKQVPVDSKGQYFRIEEYFLRQPQFGEICRKFSNILIKLNCYFDISVFVRNHWVENPQPDAIGEWVSSGQAIHVVIESKDAMIGFNGDDLYMTIYNPDSLLIELITSLANADGLLVWKPGNQD